MLDRTSPDFRQRPLQPLVLWGASGHGKVILDIAQAMGDFSPIEFLDDAPGDPARELCGCRVFPARSWLQSPARAAAPPAQFVISIGRNEVRAACFRKALDHGLSPVTLIHPSATISPSAQLEAGTVVMPRVVVNADARIGQNCILNTAAVIEHDCKIGDHVHLSPGVLLAGNVTVHAFAHLGIGAVVLPGLEIGAGATVGAGAVVTKSIPPGSTVVGIPARPRPRSN